MKWSKCDKTNMRCCLFRIYFAVTRFHLPTQCFHIYMGAFGFGDIHTNCRRHRTHSHIHTCNTYAPRKTSTTFILSKVNSVGVVRNSQLHANRSVAIEMHHFFPSNFFFFFFLCLFSLVVATLFYWFGVCKSARSHRTHFSEPSSESSSTNTMKSETT